MQSEPRMKINFLFIRLLVLFCCTAFPARIFADLTDRQSLAPMEWEKDFVQTHALSVGALRLGKGAQLVSMNDQTLNSAFGLNLANHLRDHWTGRLGLHFGRTGAEQGQFVWTSVGSDLQRPMIPESLFNVSLFKYVRPYVFFGLGAVSRWENVKSGINLIPTLRYHTSESAFYAGAQILIPFADEYMFGAEYRFLQSMKESRTRGGAVGVSVHWGRWERK